MNKYTKIIFLNHVLFPQYSIIVSNFELKLNENRIRYSKNSKTYNSSMYMRIFIDRKFLCKYES